jgi:F-type H+-transporting ATPase subunit delta
MASTAKNAQQLARRLFQLSVVDGSVSPERVSCVLAYVEKHRPANPIQVLRAYHRLVAIELAKGRAVVEHAGDLPAGFLDEIASSFSRKYRRPVTAAAQPNPALIAGLRVRVGDDLYESSVAGQLASLGSAG